jgi:hypothetical protein
VRKEKSEKRASRATGSRSTKREKVTLESDDEDMSPMNEIGPDGETKFNQQKKM